MIGLKYRYDDDETEVAEVLAACMARIDSGEVIDREAYTADHPPVADALRSYFETADRVERKAGWAASGPPPVDTDGKPFSLSERETVLPSAADSSAVGTVGRVHRSIPEVFGPYQILKPLGQSAMGIVYLALHLRTTERGKF